MRLDKYLSNAGIGSRKDVKNIISSGRVTVNGTPVRDSLGAFSWMDNPAAMW